MSPLLPKGKRPWTADPGHIHDVPEPPPMPDEQEQVGVDIPAEEIEVIQASTEAREPARRARAGPRALRGGRSPRPGPGDPPGDEALPAEALGGDPGALGGAAPLRLVHARGDRAGRGRHGRHPRLPRVRGQLLRPLPPRARGRAPGARLHQHQLLARAARTPARGLRGRRRRGGTGERRRTARSSSAASSAWAPATSRRWPRSTSATTGRSPRRTRRPPSSGSGRNSKQVLPEKRLQDRPAAGGPRGGGDKRVARHSLNKGSRPKPKAKPKKGKKLMASVETRVLFRNIDEPGLASIKTYRKFGGYQAHSQGLQGDDAGGGPQGARGLGPARPRRRRLLDGQEGLVPAARRHGQVPLLQRRRVRAGRLQGPRADAEEPAPADRGDHHRRPRRRREPLLHLHPRRVRPAGRHPRPGRRGGVRGRLPRRERPRHRPSRSSWSSTAAPAPTSAARRRRCSTRSRASAATRGSSPPSPPSRASTTGRR